MKNSTTKKIKLNIVDILIIIAVVALIGAIVVLLVLGNRPHDDKYFKIQYTVRMSGVRNEYVDYLKLGDTAYNSSSGNPIGTIINIRSEAVKTYVATNDGVVTSDSEEFSDVYLTLTTTTASKSENDIYSVDGINILVGSQLYVRVSPFAQSANIVGMASSILNYIK